ncbi:hypothetical protein AB0F46_41975, partial [Streptomyces sp. NPDC026665]|uniref:hypothetical protein n=1 Tax=Streptomyces sp. NPDC026665 TaxID=3154798 RepID=UPI00340D0275
PAERTLFTSVRDSAAKTYDWAWKNRDRIIEAVPPAASTWPQAGRVFTRKCTLESGSCLIVSPQVKSVEIPSTA